MWIEDIPIGREILGVEGLSFQYFVCREIKVDAFPHIHTPYPIPNPFLYQNPIILNPNPNPNPNHSTFYLYFFFNFVKSSIVQLEYIVYISN